MKKVILSLAFICFFALTSCGDSKHTGKPSTDSGSTLSVILFGPKADCGGSSCL